jgi:diacylglycerol kinase (ATP)
VRVCVIYNPAAKGQKAERFRALLQVIARGGGLFQTTAPRDARRLAAQAVREGYDTLIAAGGDGTLNEILNGIGDVPEGFDRTRLGALPLGTVNVFARELGMPLQPPQAWEILSAGREIRIDLAVTESGPPEARERTYFTQLAGAGLDARAIELVDWPLKKKIGPLAYVVAGLRAMTESKPRLRVSADGQEVVGELVLVGNGRLYGGSYRVFPAARFDDAQLDVCVFPRVTWPRLIRCGLSILLRQRLPESLVIRRHTAEFCIAGPDGTRFEVDGELAGKLPVTFRVVPRALRVLTR